MGVVLCIGSGNHAANELAKLYAESNSLEYQGLLDQSTIEKTGCYHSSIVDLSIDTIRKIAPSFNKLVLLNQGLNEYNCVEDYRLTVDLLNELKDLINVEFLDNAQNFSSISDLNKNKSLCLIPFIGFRKEGLAISPCCHFDHSIEFTTAKEFNFITNEKFRDLRSRMLEGQSTPECSYCQQVESTGVISPRLSWSKEWLVKLGFNTTESIQVQETHYDIRLGNECNLMCRMCIPKFSNLIDKEYYDLNLTDTKYGKIDLADFSMINFAAVRQVYVAGGEPTINTNFVSFLQKCVQQKAEFEIIINTNAMSLTREFIDLVKQLPNVKFEISVDGFDLVNKYIRWPANWDKLTRNIQTLNEISCGQISFSTVASIYNIGNIYKCLHYLDSTYPYAVKHLGYTFDPILHQPWKFPNKELALADLKKVHSLLCYQTQPALKSSIDGLEAMIVAHQNSPSDLVDFFKWNDLLDQQRGVCLKDYIPDLENYRPISN